LGLLEESKRISEAVKSVISIDKVLTQDLGGKSTTQEFTARMIERLIK